MMPQRASGLFLIALVALGVILSAQREPGTVPSMPGIWRLDNRDRIAGRAVTVLGNPKVQQTEIGDAIGFDGRGDGLLLDVNPLAGLSRFTIEVLLQPGADGPEEQRYLHIEEAGSGNRALLELRMRADARWSLDTFLRSGPAGLTLLDREIVHPAGRWYVAALSYDGRTMTHYVNGRRELSGDTAFAPLGGGKTSIGVRQNGVSWFKGLIHTIRITPEALPVGRLMRVPSGSGGRSAEPQRPLPRPAVVHAAVSEPVKEPVREPTRRALFVVGDSTVKNHGPGEGWGDYLAPHFNSARVQVLNWAMGGRSSRSFIEEGRWNKVLAQVQPGDVILVQFGHNDQRELTTDRGTIPTIGEESRSVVNEQTRATTVVRTYGSYLRQYAHDARARRATLIFISPVPRNYWTESGHFDNVLGLHATLMQRVAEDEGVPFVDLNARLLQVYTTLGRAEVSGRFFTAGDATHPNAAGAQVAAATLVDGLREAPVPSVHELLGPSVLSTFAARPPTWARGIEGQRKGDLGNGYYLNPIVAGDHPDPSILKDGSDYYMTFSSFDAYPGLVIWHSRDLVNWRPLTATLRQNVGSVWAPDLVRHEGRYFIYFPARTATYRTNYVIWADDIRGPWSAPVDLKIGQIDPGHAVGPDGKRYLFMSAGYLAPLSADGLSVTGEMRKIYDGWKYPDDWIVEGFAQEGPKIIRKGDYYYQVLAEGGTAGPPTGHMIVAARSKAIEGPWENSPYNPILRTQSPEEGWWSKGHGTLIEGPDARWWVVYHAYEKSFYNLGRQTLLEPVEWLDDEWFRVARYDPSRPIPKPLPSSTGEHGFALSDDFSTNKMGTQWSFYKGSAEDQTRYRYEDHSLVLKAKGTSPADSSPLWFVTGDHAYEFEVEIEASAGATAGDLLFYNQRLYVGLGYSAKNLIMHSYGIERPGSKPAHLGNRLFLRLRNDRHLVTFAYSVDGQTWERYDRGMEVSGYHHNVGYDFLSLRPALYAAGSGEVRFRNFEYRALPE